MMNLKMAKRLELSIRAEGNYFKEEGGQYAQSYL
jgi:hypothetical protein